MSFASRLKERREGLGITQVQLAERLGVTKGAVGNYETGLSSPKAEILYKVFDVLGCDANYLFQDEMDENNDHTILDDSEYPVMAKYRRLTDVEKNSIDEIIDRTLSGQPIGDIAATQKKPAPTNEDGQTLIEKRLFTLFQQIPESSQPLVLDMIEAALKSQGLL